MNAIVEIAQKRIVHRIDTIPAFTGQTPLPPSNSCNSDRRRVECFKANPYTAFALEGYPSMKTLGWPPTYVARCPVTLFEAARGSTSWQTGGTVGELHMRPLGGAVLHFQLNDLLDGQVLFEHTMRKPDAISVPVDRFFVIRQENESFRGFGFRDKDAACEMRERIQKAVKPFTIGYAPPVITTIKSHEKEASDSDTSQTVGSFCKKSEVLKCESVPKRSSVRKKSLQRGGGFLDLHQLGTLFPLTVMAVQLALQLSPQLPYSIHLMFLYSNGSLGSYYQESLKLDRSSILLNCTDFLMKLIPFMVWPATPLVLTPASSYWDASESNLVFLESLGFATPVVDSPTVGF
eukprot:Gb_01193 [translate_table: standard]